MGERRSASRAGRGSWARLERFFVTLVAVARPCSICADVLRRAQVDAVIRRDGVAAAVARFPFGRSALYRHAAHVPPPDPEPPPAPAAPAGTALLEAPAGAGSATVSARALLLFALVLPLISACTTTGENMEAGLRWFAAKPVDQLVRVIGYPTRTMLAAGDEGNLFYVWEYRETRSSSDSAYAMRPTTDGRYTYAPSAPTIKACRIVVEVASGEVVGWNWTQTGTSSYLGGCARYAYRFQRHLEATP